MVVAVAVGRRTWSPAPWSWPAAVALGAILALAAVQFFPGFPLAAKNRDPGVYVNHAVAIARQGRRHPDGPGGRDGRRAGRDRRRRPHRDRRGRGGLAAAALPQLPHRPRRPGPHPPGLLPPLAGDPRHRPRPRWDRGAVQPHPAVRPRRRRPPLPRRPAGVRPRGGLGDRGAAGGQRAEVWQAKFPTAESMSLFFYAGALLAVALALSTRWRVAAGIGGALVGVGFVARPEGIVVVGLAAIVLAGLWVLDRVDGRAVGLRRRAGPAPLLGRLPGLRPGLALRPPPTGPALLRGGRGGSGAAGPRRGGRPLGAPAGPGGPTVRGRPVRRRGPTVGGPGPGPGLPARRLRPDRAARRLPGRGLVPGGPAGSELPHRQARRAVPWLRRAQPDASGPVHHADGPGRGRRGAGRRRPRPLVGRPVGAGATGPGDRPGPHLGARASPRTSCGGAAGTSRWSSPRSCC